MSLTIYHNPKCSKSRTTLALLRDKGLEPVVVDYLSTPPDVETLKSIIAALGCGPRDIMRAKESKEAGLNDPSLDDATILKRMVENPIVIERPIVTIGTKAAMGRPPEAVLDILD